MVEVEMTRKQLKQWWRRIRVGIANDLRNELVRACPVDTGRLKGSIKYRVKGNVVEIYMVGYALYVEFGTPPHIIRPKNKKALRWNPDRGRKAPATNDIFAKEVHHPGTMPQPFIRNTLRTKLKGIIQRNMKMAMNEASA